MGIDIEPAPDGGYVLRGDCFVARPLADVFAFFADAMNLERITPRWIRFRVLTPPPIAMARGATIDYRLRLRGVPLSWQSEITAWEPPRLFVDEQRRGPYKYWRHEHRFEEQAGGTRVIDEVRYAARGGRLVNTLLVAPDLKRIFRFRQEALLEILA